MRLPNFLVNNKNKINKITNFFTNITKELSLIIWVIIVFLLILYSYIENEYNLNDISKYEQINLTAEIYDISEI